MLHTLAMTLYVCMHDVYWPSKIGFCKLCFYFCVKCYAPIHASIISQMLMLAYYAQNSDASIICKALLASYTQKLQCLPSLYQELTLHPWTQTLHVGLVILCFLDFLPIFQNIVYHGTLTLTAMIFRGW